MLASNAQAHDVSRAADGAHGKNVVLVSCYRGPWEAVIWDRPNPEFIQSLEDNGFSTTKSIEIAEAICRDPRLVNNPDLTAEQVRRLTSAARRG